MTNLRRPDVIRLFAFSMLLLIFPATSWAQPRPPLAEQMAKTYGLDAFGQIEGIRYTFTAELPGVKLSRSWEWNPKTDTVSYQGKDKSGKPVTATYQRSQLGSQSDAIKNQIDPAFINDQYWLLLPFHVIWDGSATVTDEGMQKLPIGDGAAERLVMKYPSQGGGYAPGDTWELYVGADKRVEQMVYRRGGTEAKPSACDRDVGRQQKGWSAPRLHRSPRDGGRKAPADFSFGCVGQSEGIRRLDQSAMNIGRAARKGRPSSVLPRDSSGRHAMKPDDLVAVGIAQIGEIHLAGGPLADARRVLDRGAAIRNAGIVPRLGLFGVAHRKADRAAIGMVRERGLYAVRFPCGDDRRAGYFVGLIWRGARPAALSSAVIWRKHSMPDSVKAVTPSSPGP